MPDLARFNTLAAQIETELRALGAWQSGSLPREILENAGEFGQKTMVFTQWIQFVLVVGLRQVGTATIPVPPKSQVGPEAIREFENWPEATELTRLLIEVDSLVTRSH